MDKRVRVLRWERFLDIQEEVLFNIFLSTIFSSCSFDILIRCLKRQQNVSTEVVLSKRNNFFSSGFCHTRTETTSCKYCLKIHDVFLCTIVYNTSCILKTRDCKRMLGSLHPLTIRQTESEVSPYCHSQKSQSDQIIPQLQLLMPFLSIPKSISQHLPSCLYGKVYIFVSEEDNACHENIEVFLSQVGVSPLSARRCHHGRVL